MSNTRYIEISSNYRNRNDWPLPSEFEVSISRSGVCDKTTARDPVSDCAPEAAWVSNSLQADTTMTTIALNIVGFGTAGVGEAGNYQTVFVEQAIPADDKLQEEENYYVGLMGQDGAGNAHRVIAYRYLGTNAAGTLERGEFVFDGQFPNPTAVVTLTDPTDLAIQEALQVYVPNGRTGTNSYPNCLLYNETRQQGAPITNYSFTTHLVEADASAISPFNWLATDAYSIRKCVPSFTQSLAAPAILSSTVFSLPITASNVDGSYVGDFIRITDATDPPVLPIVPPTGESRRINRYVSLDANLVNATPEANPNAFTLTGGSMVNGFYNGAHILIGGVYYEINSYTYDATTQTRTGTVTAPIAANAAGTPITIRSAFVSPAFSAVPLATNSFELLPFSRDNYNTLMYSGSTVSQQEMVCYEVELMNLVLPNRTLAVGQGSRIAFYPYVYVELTNVSSASAGTRNIIYSNNPNSARMLFRAPIDDIPNPVVSSFIKIDSDGTVQTVKFKPNDTLHFSVRLPNGELYQTTLSEDFSPYPPNAENQISALFAIKRL